MNKTFYLFGDSICFGQLVSPHQTWINVLAGAIEPLMVQNASVNGNTTRQALERMPYEVTSHRPDFVLVQFGMNDCNYWESDFGLPRVSPKAFIANLEEIVTRALAAGATRVFLNTNHPSAKGAFRHLPKLTHAESNRQYNALIRETHATMVTRGLPVTLTDVESAWMQELDANAQLSLEDLLLPDGIHLSRQGHDLYARIVIPSILETVAAH